MAESLELIDRVRVPDDKVGELEELPGRMNALESQFVEFRRELRSEFSALRRDCDATLERRFGEQVEMLDERFAQMDQQFAQVTKDLAVLRKDTGMLRTGIGTVLRKLDAR